MHAGSIRLPRHFLSGHPGCPSYTGFESDHKYFYAKRDVFTMDDASKEQFRWRFWHLTVILNGVILFFALVPIAYYLFPVAYRVPGAVISLFLAVMLTVVFRRNYYKTKAWLSDHA